MKWHVWVLAAMLAMGAGGFALAQKARASFRDCKDGCPEMIQIPAGHFIMGSPDSERGREGDETLHDVTIGYAFAMEKYEVTRQEFAQFVAATQYDAKSDGCYGLAPDGSRFDKFPNINWESPGYAQTDTDPVVCVNLTDAQAYADWLSRKTGKEYRLPSESEWEYAARAGTLTPYYWGSDYDSVCTNANVADQKVKARFSNWAVPPCNDRYLYTAPVGSYPANAFGLYDMTGNVWEWTEDCYRSSYNFSPVNGEPMVDEECGQHVLRGSPWYLNQWSARMAYRGWGFPLLRDIGVGFRVVRKM